MGPRRNNHLMFGFAGEQWTVDSLLPHRHITAYGLTSVTQELKCGLHSHHRLQLKVHAFHTRLLPEARTCRQAAKAFGQLVQLGFDVAVFTPAAYQRPRLGRPSKEPSSCGRLRT